jgi:hypothetical protein
MEAAFAAGRKCKFDSFKVNSKLSLPRPFLSDAICARGRQPVITDPVPFYC